MCQAQNPCYTTTAVRGCPAADRANGSKHRTAHVQAGAHHCAGQCFAWAIGPSHCQSERRGVSDRLTSTRHSRPGMTPNTLSRPARPKNPAPQHRAKSWDAAPGMWLTGIGLEVSCGKGIRCCRSWDGCCHSSKCRLGIFSSSAGSQHCSRCSLQNMHGCSSIASIAPRGHVGPELASFVEGSHPKAMGMWG